MVSPEINPLAQLLAGECHDSSDLAIVIQHLATTLSGLMGQVDALEFDKSASAQVSILGPYLARGILELGFAILLARLDPFRVLVLHRVQQSSDFEIDQRNSCALQWKGDFVPAEKVENPWKSSRKPADMTRALLGDYNDHVFWRPCFVSLLDGVPDAFGGQWMSSLRLVPPDTFTRRVRGQAEHAYTACSKGVHHEFVIPLAAYYGSDQILELLRQVTEITATLGLVLNCGSHIPFCMPKEKALSHFENVQQQVQEIHG